MEEVKVFIEGGFILLAKNIIEDEIWEKPPMYLKVWIWILSNTEYRTDNKRLKRGEVFLNVNTLREECSHYSGFRKVTPSYKEIYNILQWLQFGDKKFAYGGNYGEEDGGTMEGNMVVTTGVKSEKRYRVLNYNVYQSSESYGGKHGGKNEGNTEVNTDRTRRENLLLDKELKETKELKELNTTPPSENKNQDYAAVVQHLEKCGFGVISPNTFEDIQYWLDTFDKEMVLEAINIADYNGKNFWNYPKGILRKWKQANLKTLAEVKAHETKENYTPKTEQESESMRQHREQQRIQAEHMKKIMADEDMEDLPF